MKKTKKIKETKEKKTKKAKKVEKLLKMDNSTTKQCPNCKKNLLSAIFYNVEVDYCPRCLGMWFDEDELRWAKDEKDRNLKWLDVDLWKDEKKFKVSYGAKICPTCRVPLYEVYYGNSGIIVDVCRLCHGIWLDRVEFKKIIGWLHVKADYEIMNNYAKNLFEEAVEIFSGPEVLKEEIEDFLIVLTMLNYRFCILYPVFSKIILDLPR